MFARVHYYNVFIIPLSFYRPLKGLLKNGKNWKVTSDEWLFHLSGFQGAFLLSAYLPKTTSRRAASHVPTQMTIRRDVAPTASGRSWKGKTCHIMLTDLTFNLMDIKLMAVKLGGREWDMRKECTWFGTRMHVIRDNYCILAIFFVSLHCHSLRTANGKLTTKKRREKRQGCTPAQSLSKCWTIKKRKEKRKWKRKFGKLSCRWLLLYLLP